MKEVSIVSFSDTHNLHRMVQLSKCDISIFGGDFSGRGSRNDTEDFMDWYNKQNQCDYKIMVAGNHDLCFDPKYNRETGANFWLSDMLKKYPDIIYLENDSVNILGLWIWGSPITPDFYPQHWAFNKSRGETIKEYWDKIPKDTDIIVTHGPPEFIGDRCDDGHVGCKDLADTITRIKPKLHISGHIHEGYGSIQIENTAYLNVSVCDKHYRALNLPILSTITL